MESGNTRPQLPSDDADERVISTTLCGALVDKDGKVLKRFCITVPGEYPPKSPKPEPDSTGEESSPPARQEEA